MSAAARNRKFEFFVMVAIVGLLATLLLEGLAVAQRRMEETSVENEIAAQRIELLDRVAHRATWGGAQPEGSNPVAWTGRKPTGYLGEIGENEKVLHGGVWYYRQGAGVLVYRFQAGDEWRYRLKRGVKGDGVAIVDGIGLFRVEDSVEENGTQAAAAQGR